MSLLLQKTNTSLSTSDILVDDNAKRGLHNHFHSTFNPVICGKKQYIAPEIWNGHGNPDKHLMLADIWSLGILFFMLATYRAPFEQAVVNDERFALLLESNSIISFIAEIVGNDEVEADDNKMLWDLIDKILKPKPEDRITIEEILTHPFFD